MNTQMTKISKGIRMAIGYMPHIVFGPNLPFMKPLVEIGRDNGFRRALVDMDLDYARAVLPDADMFDLFKVMHGARFKSELDIPPELKEESRAWLIEHKILPIGAS